ncbi:hypothetical protein GE061_004313 [Apolygus lucorum]|uniref:Uncharacterized protein n=1 Tax=Apolygus lucorum TaxID=248454 RepID=A0A6A4IP49_APOLU|nr:hypothetical protein GE061_004313 [Apolygus lucorum]
MPRCYMVKKACNKYQGQKEDQNPEEVQEQEPSATGPGFYRPISETVGLYVADGVLPMARRHMSIKPYSHIIFG